jgi:hypothetical protein
MVDETFSIFISYLAVGIANLLKQIVVWQIAPQMGQFATPVKKSEFSRIFGRNRYRLQLTH